MSASNAALVRALDFAQRCGAVESWRIVVLRGKTRYVVALHGDPRPERILAGPSVEVLCAGLAAGRRAVVDDRDPDFTTDRRDP